MRHYRFGTLSRLSGVLLLLLAISAWSAEVYRVVDEQGRVTFTDSPPRGKQADKVEVKESNRLPAAPTVDRPPREEEPAPTDYQLRITYPPNDFHVNPGVRSVEVQVAVEPALKPNHNLQITDNGAPLPGTRLENIVVRGTHLVQARVVSREGEILAESEPVQIHVHRPSVAR
ncbi:DUF4124 domain-containing protein [Gilvimarinus sp. F26214L]|uniref:DUF4124 domain-containing protein n=1 Tax=Gilvimarinus sp. DZF01 TaxID=3461371 RepID=UPI00404687DC